MLNTINSSTVPHYGTAHSARVGGQPTAVIGGPIP